MIASIQDSVSNSRNDRMVSRKFPEESFLKNVSLPEPHMPGIHQSYERVCSACMANRSEELTPRVTYLNQKVFPLFLQQTFNKT